MSILSRTTSLFRAAIFGLAVTGVALSALPAQAAPILKPNFDIQVLKPEIKKPLGTTLKKFDYDFSWCLTNKQIRKGLKKAGFDEIDFVKELKQKRVRVEALYEDDGWVYSMRIDRCDGDVDQIKPLYEYDEFDFDIEF